MKKRIVVAILLSTVLLINGCSSGSKTVSTTKSTNRTVTRGNIQLGLTYDGKVAIPVTNLNFDLDGTVKKVYVNVGDAVTKGELLAELDDTDYQLEITNAKNNLEKANVSYQDALRQKDYSITNGEMSLSTTKRKLDEAYDATSYQFTVEDAKVTLERKKSDLEKAQKDYDTPFDDYTYQNAIADAKINIERKKADLERVIAQNNGVFDDYTYQLAINDAKINLERKKVDLDNAQSDLSDVQGKSSTFDSTTYDNAINTAKTNLLRKENDVNTANAKYKAAQSAYDAAPTDANKKTRDDAETAFTTAQRAYEDAQASLSQASNNLFDARDNFNDNNDDSKDTDVKNAKNKVTSAENAYNDAQRTYDKAVSDLQRAKKNYTDDHTTAIQNAQNAVSDAERAYTKAQEDLERARKKYGEDNETSLTNAKNAVADAEQNLNKAVYNLAKSQTDFGTQKASSQDSYNAQVLSLQNEKASTSSILNAQLNVESAKVNLQQAENDLEKVKVYAPSDGNVISINLKEGERATGKSTSSAVIFGTSNSSNNFMTIASNAEIYLTASVSESDITAVELDQLVRVTLDSIEGERFDGKVYTISNLPSTDSSGITTYTVTIKLNETDPRLLDGMSAVLNFIKKEKNNILLIPNKAVSMKEGKQYVTVVKPDGSTEERGVVCGFSNGTDTEVVSGLEEGETVMVGGPKV